MKILPRLLLSIALIGSLFGQTPKENLQRTIGTNTIAGTQAAAPLKVETIAALKAIAGSQRFNGQQVEIANYAVANDGGGGLFYFDSASTTADNGGTVIAPAAGGVGRWKRNFTGPINVQWFGARGTNTYDQVPIAAAIAACATEPGLYTSRQQGRGLYLPKGIYRVDSMQILFSGMAITGEGRGATVIKLTGASHYGIYTPASVYNYRGPWLTSTLYAVNDVALHGGSNYICLIAHTSGVFATDLAAGKWVPQTQGDSVINVSISNLSIDAAALPATSAYHAIHLENTWMDHLQNVAVINHQTEHFGLAIWDNAYTSLVENCSLQNIKIKGTSGDLRAIQHTFINIDTYHFDISYASNITVMGSALQGGYPEKFLLNTVDTLRVTGCDIETGPTSNQVIYRGNCTNLFSQNSLSGEVLTSGYADPQDFGFLIPSFHDNFLPRANGVDPTAGGRYTPMFGNGVTATTTENIPFFYDRLLNMYGGRRKGTITNTPFEERTANEEILVDAGSSASTISLSNGVAKQLGTSIVIDGGIWEAQGWVFFSSPDGAAATATAMGIQEVVGAPEQGRSGIYWGNNAIATSIARLNVVPYRINIAAGNTMTLKLVAYCAFSGGTVNCWGSFRVVRL